MKYLARFRMSAGLVMAVLLAAVAVPAAQATNTTWATITVVAPGAALGQPVEVQWGDPLGGWHTVDGWKGSFANITPQGEPFQRWTVGSGNFGQQPFRWVIYYPDGQTVWAVGPWFALPGVAGQDYAQRLDVQNPTPTVPVPPPPAPTGPVAPAGGEPLLNGHGFTYGLVCACGDSKISAIIGGLPASTWITVQWQGGLGQWHTVDGWQGMASSVDANGGLFQQWDVAPSLFGLGPFRWALYNFQGGSLVGVSPSFNMPVTSRVDFFMSMAPF